MSKVFRDVPSRRAQQPDASAPAAQESLHLDTNLFTLQEVPGKGKGLVASQNIVPGTCVLSEAPLMTTANVTSIETAESDLGKELRGMPRESQRAFLSLHNNYPGEGQPMSNIFRSNAYPLGPGAEVGGVFLTIARINHSCRPNCQQAWSPLTGKETIYAVRPIKIGEEITLSYHNGGTSLQRKEILKDSFRFDCTCDACSLPQDQLEISDARLARAHVLDGQIGDSKRVHNTPEKALADCRELLTIYEREGISDSRLSRLYYDAFQICIIHSDQARAKVFGNRYRELKVLAEGQDSFDALEIMAYTRKPSSHSSFGATKKWSQSIKQVPRDLEHEEFQSWLWRTQSSDVEDKIVTKAVKTKTENVGALFLTWPNS